MHEKNIAFFMTYSQAITGQGSVECRKAGLLITQLSAEHPSVHRIKHFKNCMYVSLINNSSFDYLSHSSCRNCSYFQFSKLINIAEENSL